MMAVCVDLFRDVLRYYVEPAELQRSLIVAMTHLKRIMSSDLKNFFKMSQWGTEMPSSAITDLSLLYILIRFSSNIPPPKKGWGEYPESDDKSLASCIERIRILGKKIMDHSENEDINESDYQDILTNLRTNIGEIQKMVFTKTNYAQAVDELCSRELKQPDRRYITDFKLLKGKTD